VGVWKSKHSISFFHVVYIGKDGKQLKQIVPPLDLFQTAAGLFEALAMLISY
jgi:hypothetical protein